MNETWGDLVRKYFPNADDKLCDYILWEKTTFPLASVERVEEQIKDYKTERYYIEVESKGANS